MDSKVKSNIHLLRVPGEKTVREDIFDMIMAETFPELISQLTFTGREVQCFSNRIKKINTHLYTLVEKLQDTNSK